MNGRRLREGSNVRIEAIVRSLLETESTGLLCVQRCSNTAGEASLVRHASASATYTFANEIFGTSASATDKLLLESSSVRRRRSPGYRDLLCGAAAALPGVLLMLLNRALSIMDMPEALPTRGQSARYSQDAAGLWAAQMGHELEPSSRRMAESENNSDRLPTEYYQRKSRFDPATSLGTSPTPSRSGACP